MAATQHEPQIPNACRHLLVEPNARSFAMHGPFGRVRKCFMCAVTDGRMLRRSFFTALVVGTLLTLINQCPALFNGDFSSNLAWKVPLTYLVPFCVTSWGALANAYLRHSPT